MAVPTQIRRRIVEDYKDYKVGMSYRELAEKWRVSVGTVSNIMKEFRETGEVTPPQQKRVRKPKLEGRREEVVTFLEKNKNATLTDVRKFLKVEVCLVTIWRQMKKWGLSHKKK